MFSDSENSISCPVAYAKAQQKDDCRHNMDLDKCLPTWQGRPIKKNEAGIHLNSPLRRTTTTCRGIHAHTIIIHTLFSVSLSRVTVPKDFEHTSSLRQNMRSTLGNQEYRCKIKDNCANDQQKVHPKFIHF